MSVKPEDVKKLRDKTGAGMLDAKKALVHTNGNFAEAEKYLKVEGLVSAEKKQGRATGEGRIFFRITEDKALLLELLCETDFVARTEGFIRLGEQILDDILLQNLSSPTPELENLVKNSISIFGENMSLSRFKTLPIADDERAAGYIHTDGKTGVLVKVKTNPSSAKEKSLVREYAHDCALHAAAFAPLYLNRESIDPAYIKDQEDVARGQSAKLDKPANVIEGIVKGKVNKMLEQVSFADQPFVKHDKLTVSAVGQEVGKQVGATVTLSGFLYYQIGAGEK